MNSFFSDSDLTDLNFDQTYSLDIDDENTKHVQLYMKIKNPLKL